MSLVKLLAATASLFFAVTPFAYAQSENACGPELRESSDFGMVPLRLNQSSVSAAQLTEGLGVLEFVRPYNETQRRKWRSDSVGRLDVVLSNGCLQTCTATLLPDNTIVTARHCFRLNPGLQAVDAQIIFGHLSSLDTDADVTKANVDLGTIETYTLDGYTYDVATAKLVTPPNTSLPQPAFLSRAPIEVGESAYNISHPNGRPQMIARSACMVLEISDREFRHRCDTQAGSSGSAIFDEETRTIVGIHGHTEGASSGPSDRANIATRLDILNALLEEKLGDAVFASNVTGSTSSVTQADIDIATRVMQLSEQLGFSTLQYPAYRELEMLAESGSAEAMFSLSSFLRADHEGIPKDLDRARAYQNAAAQLGNPDAKTIALFERYKDDQDNPEYEAQLETLADQGAFRAMSILSNRYYNKAKETDEKTKEYFYLGKSLDWLEKAAKTGSFEGAKFFRFRAGFDGLDIGRLRNPESPESYYKEVLNRAEGYFLNAAERGCMACWLSLASLHTEHSLGDDGQKRLYYIEKAIEAGNPNAPMAKARLLFKGAPGVPKNISAALPVLEAFADRADLEDLAFLYYEGKEVQKDLEKAELFARKSLESSGGMMLRPVHALLADVSRAKGTATGTFEGYAFYWICGSDIFFQDEEIYKPCIIEASDHFRYLDPPRKRRVMETICSLSEQYPAIEKMPNNYLMFGRLKCEDDRIRVKSDNGNWRTLLSDSSADITLP